MQGMEEQNIDLEEDILNCDEEDGVEEEKADHSLLYKKRLKSLIKDVAVTENFFDIRMGKPGLERLQDTVKLLTIILIYETINSLRKGNRKIIKPHFIDEALNKTMIGADSLGFSISKLQALLQDLEIQNNSTSISKAVDFININDTLKKEGK